MSTCGRSIAVIASPAPCLCPDKASLGKSSVLLTAVNVVMAKQPFPPRVSALRACVSGYPESISGKRNRCPFLRGA